MLHPKNLIKVLVIVIFVIGLIFIHRTKHRESSELSQTSQAAFLLLDKKIAKCTTPVFIFEVPDSGKQIAPLFENLGTHHVPVTTNSDRAQKYFDQGIRLTYAFNHAEGHRAFMEAARLDPDCGMAFWGQAYALGPNINDPYPDAERMGKAYEASQKAIELSDNLTEKERDLIQALSSRYDPDSDKPIEDLNKSYMEAMKQVVEKYPDDADIQTLYGAAIMNTMPWNYWDNKGNPRENILEGKAALERAMELNEEHPGAHHYYIHMVELPKPDLGVPSAERLGKLMPAAGHLVHMPSHIYIRVGRYEDAAKANVDAIAADEDYISQCLAQGSYPLGYYPHNIHFLWSAATFLGDSETALRAAEKTADKVPVGELTTLTFLQDYISSPMLANLRFGLWNEVLTTPFPGEEYKHVVLIWHYTRGVAFVRKGNLEDAKEELEAIKKLAEDPDLENLIANYTNPSSKIAEVAVKVVAGEIAAAEGDYEKAVKLLKEGVESEDKLVYSEPPAWHIPVRQTLGAVLLKADRPEEAEKVYLEDLKVIRENGWSLIGLHNSLKAQGKTKEAAEAKKRYEKAWAKADIDIKSSVL